MTIFVGFVLGHFHIGFGFDQWYAINQFLGLIPEYPKIISKSLLSNELSAYLLKNASGRNEYKGVRN